MGSSLPNAVTTQFNNPYMENSFQNWITGLPWYSEFQNKYGESPNLNDPMYDYRKAWLSGVTPQVNPYDKMYHWSSKTPSGEWLKAPDHPTAWMQTFMEHFGYDPDSKGIKKEEGLRMIEQARGGIR